MIQASSILASLGLASFFFVLYRLFSFLTTYLRPSTLRRYQHPPQPWALITGSTDGIGLGYALELASSGFSLIMHGRNAQKLASASSQIRSQFPSISIRLFVHDATSTKPLGETDLSEILKDIHLTVLVNNVGGGYYATTPREIDDLINVNTRFPVQLTRFLLPTLIRNAPALVLTMGSDADIGVPWLDVYCGAKAFLMSWSAALATEMAAEGHDVKVLALRTGTVNTAGNPSAETIMTPSARDYARMCLDRVGVQPRVVHGYVMHAVGRGILDLLPEKEKERIFQKLMRGRMLENEKKK